MTDKKEYTPGSFCWFDLATNDTEKAKEFYTGLFAWEPVDVPMKDGAYTMLMQEGKEIGALYGMSDQQAEVAPPHWLSYVSVESADGTAEKVKTSGGTIIEKPFDVMDVGRMCVFQEPTGALMAVWEPKSHTGAQKFDEIGAVCWNELMTNDTEKASAFFADVFGWSANAEKFEGMDYSTFKLGEKSAGGMMAIKPEWGDVPSNWMVYFSVDDCDAVVEKTKELGGDVIVPPKDIDKVGRFATLKDPQGAVFSVIKLNLPGQG